MPTITVDGNVQTEASLGASIELPSATVVDDVDSEIECKIYVFGPDSSVRFSKKSFTANKKGVYRICYVAVDKAGNVAVKEFKLEVK